MKTRIELSFLLLICTISVINAQTFDGLSVGPSTLHRLSNAQTRSISAENFTGEKGKAAMAVEGTGKHHARDLGQGWKISPFIHVPGNSTFTLAEIDGSGAIQQIWMTPAPFNRTRELILRFYWDGEETPSVECPMSDFFTCGWQEYCQNNSLMVNVNPGSAFSCHWTMPFRKKAKITVENLNPEQCWIYYQINYVLADVPDDAAYFHAQFRRVNPVKAKDVVTIVDGIKGKGHYVGTYMAWEIRKPFGGWWGEGEIKFYLDGDKEFPTIAGTGTEDYFLGSYNFDQSSTHNGIEHTEFSSPYSGLVQVLPKGVAYKVGQRFGLYRWHITDPVRFEKDLKITFQDLGWTTDGRYLPLEDDISSVGFWYQTEPHAPFPKFPEREKLLIAPLFFSDWKLTDCGTDLNPGYRAEYHGKKYVLMTHPKAKGEPCILSQSVELPKDKKATLKLAVAAHEADKAQSDWELIVKADGKELLKKTIVGGWQNVAVDLSEYAGKTVKLELLNQPNGWWNEAGYWSEIKIEY
ncbi:hypothetical protein FACS1894170_00020 [Planctomycetales bacterium]|nr:hypothetical protein FACS1894170_00020 [Planctomycetales bacterium]